MSRWCIILVSGNVVWNIIEWDGVAQYTPPDGTYLAEADDTVDIGWIYEPATRSYFPFI